MEPQTPDTPPLSTQEPQMPTNALAVTQPGEHTLFVVKRHPIGIIGIYAICAVLLLISAVLAFVVVPGNTSGSGAAASGSALLFLGVAIFCVVFTLISDKIYRGNSWVLTTDSITQISQTGLFDRQSSQLSLENLEDVTSEQNGIFAHMFNYGVIKIETASETGKFVFMFCPDPNRYAQQILAARETFKQLADTEIKS